MQSNFTNEDFERFLKHSANGCRMRPSDDVWKGISRNLHERKRRVGFVTAAFLLVASLLGYFSIESSKDLLNQADTAAGGFSASNRSFSPAPPDATKQATPATTPTDNTILSRQTVPTEEEPAAAEEEGLLAKVIPLFKREVLPPAPAAAANGPELTAIAQATPPPAITGEEVASAEVADEAVSTETLLSVENVTNTLRALRNRGRMTFQVFFTPTISYRKLSENKALIRNFSAPNNMPNYPALYDINNAVTHKPAIGLELGFAAKYPVAKNLKVKGGLQFNVNRYDIRAFSYSPEVATIALRNGPRVDYLGNVTSYRNFNGNRPDWLENLYFQVSAPVGLEVKLRGNDKMHFGVASSIQPTYVIGERAYLLSSDYKNYTTVPWLTRKWNVNTSLETFVTYSTGKMNWQVGPQVRYQLMSSFISKYPVKENLFDFGLKVGVSLNKSQPK